MTAMSFSSKKARTYLLTHSEVYSFRKHQRTTGRAWIRKKYGKPKIADAFVTEIGCLSPNDLLPYVPKSGFASLQEWIEEIKLLNGGKLPQQGFLYYVQLEPKRV